MKRWLHALGLLGMLLGSACYVTRFTFHPGPGQMPEPEGDSQWHHNGIYGLVEFSSPVRLDTLCPEGVFEIEQRVSFVNGLVQSLTQHLYNPQTVTVTCVSGARAEAVTDGSGAMVAYLPLSGSFSAH
jgi:hypothetical protein